MIHKIYKDGVITEVRYFEHSNSELAGDRVSFRKNEIQEWRDAAERAERVPVHEHLMECKSMTTAYDVMERWFFKKIRKNRKLLKKKNNRKKMKIRKIWRNAR